MSSGSYRFDAPPPHSLRKSALKGGGEEFESRAQSVHVASEEKKKGLPTWKMAVKAPSSQCNQPIHTFFAVIPQM